ncbi:hypothetical protein KDL67_02525 [bacterium]|nr:hypothetical protein [bacterium]
MRGGRLARLALAALLLLGVASCGHYHSTSRGRTLQGTIAIPFLENRTAQPDLELRATEALIDAIEADGGLRLVPRGQERYLLTGTVARYGEAPFSIGDAGTADEYKLSLVLLLSFRDQETGDDLWKDRRFSGSESFFVEGSAAGEELTRDRAEEKALQQIIDAVLNAIFGDW